MLTILTCVLSWIGPAANADSEASLESVRVPLKSQVQTNMIITTPVNVDGFRAVTTWASVICYGTACVIEPIK